MSRIIICTATDIEADCLPAQGTIIGAEFEVLVTGVGPVNAAMATSRRINDGGVGAVVCLGIGGAYPNSGLEIGQVVCAASEFYADLGADSPEGFHDMKELGFPVVGEYFNRLPLNLFPTSDRVPFATRSTCTGRLEDALEIERRTGCAVESMEGAAIVHVALAYGIAVGELRGISNAVGNRDLSTWRISQAARAAASTLLTWIEETAGS